MLLKIVASKRRKPIRLLTVSYRIPLPVTEVLVLAHGDNYPICPRCDYTIEREYMNYCDRCGQRLGWAIYDFAVEIPAPRYK